MLKRGPRFTGKEKLAILKEGEKNGVKAACAKYGISDGTYRVWRYEAQGLKPRKHFSLKKKLKILEEGARDGVYRTYAAYHINPTTYYKWKHKLGSLSGPGGAGRSVSARKRRLGYCRSRQRSFTEEARRLIVNDAIKDVGL